jgi:hypothetical protein
MLSLIGRRADPKGPATAGSQPTAPAAAPGRRAKLAARLRSGTLDRALIAGADPARSGALAARAALLTSRRCRTEVAEGLERLVGAARGPQRRWWDLGHREAVLENSRELQELAMELRGDSPVYASGVARLHRLIVDGTGPAHGGRASALARELSDARAALGGAAWHRSVGGSARS